MELSAYSEIVNFDTFLHSIDCQLGRFIGVFEVFLSIIYFKWERLVQLNSALLSCSSIVISILTFLYEIFELIKMMMMMMMNVYRGYYDPEIRSIIYSVLNSVLI